MVFSSPTFLLAFLPAFLLGYALVPKSARNGWLLLASLAFYAYGAPEFLPLLLLSSLLNFYSVAAMDKYRRFALWWLWVGILLNVGLLLYYKYANFAVDVVEQLTGHRGPWTDLALPIGISFFTFQSLSYNLDVYRREQPRLRQPAHYLLYIFSFPQMIAGPIVRYGDVAQELVHRVFTRANVVEGSQRFAVGLAKKVFLANRVAAAFPLTPDGAWTGVDAWAALIAYALQIYFDFSGYSDMAIGLGKIMGFHFPENFNRPYSATSFTDFWRRWHQTLSFWMRDYLYVALGGNRRGTGRTYMNLLLVFAVSGFWHGASWNFLLWGLYHGLFLVAERSFFLSFLNRLPRLAAQLWTLFWVVVGWALFAVVDFSELHHLLTGLFYPADWGTWNASTPKTLILVVAGGVALFPVFGWWSKITRYQEHGPRAWWLHVALALAALVELSGSGFNPFIYFRF